MADTWKENTERGVKTTYSSVPSLQSMEQGGGEEGHHLVVQVFCVCMLCFSYWVAEQPFTALSRKAAFYVLWNETCSICLVWKEQHGRFRWHQSQTWTETTGPTSFHSAPHSQESFIVLQILKGLRCSPIGTSCSLFLSFCSISNRVSRGWHLLSSCCLGMWCLLGKDSGSIWRFWKGLCPCSLFRGLRGVSYCEIRWCLSLASAVMAAE